MTGNNHSEYDAIGELFRQRLECHRIPVDDNGWDVIEHRLGKQKKSKATIWLWSVGAAAAAVAALLMVGRPVTDETAVMIVSQQIATEEAETTNHGQEIQGFKDSRIQRFKDSKIQGFKNSRIQKFNDSMIHSFNDSVTQLISYSVIPDKLDVSSVEERPETDKRSAKKSDKWLLAAAFGMNGGNTDGISDAYNLTPRTAQSYQKAGLSGSNNEYAANMSGYIQPFNDMTRKDFSKIRHRPPLTVGVTARKSIGKHAGMETGLVYTYLTSQFGWSDQAGYDVRQSLHYVGIPVNMTVYLWNSKPNWRIYLSGGFAVEKGLRAIYRQEKWQESEFRITTVKSSVDGLQWSLNGALGVNYRLEKGWGVYFEPRVGYSFDCKQPVSIRTECPIYFGVYLGLNYELN